MPDAPGRSRFVRQFAITNGRPRSEGDDLALNSIVIAADPAPDSTAVGFDHRAALSLCGEPISVAEISAHLEVYLGVARVLVCDLRNAGFVVIAGEATSDDGPDLDTLERLLDDLQAF